MNPLHTWRRDTPEQPVVEVPEWRFGLPFFPEEMRGDIAATAMIQQVGECHGTRQTAKLTHFLLHQGLRYVSAGAISGHETDMYEVAPLPAGAKPPPRIPYCYSGERVAMQGVASVLVRPLKFRAALPTVEMMRWTLRCQWAFGGWFAHRHADYASFVRHRRHEHIYGGSRNAARLVEAAKVELSDICLLPMNRESLAALCRRDHPWMRNPPWAVATGPVKRFALTPDDYLESLISD